MVDTKIWVKKFIGTNFNFLACLITCLHNCIIPFDSPCIILPCISRDSYRQLQILSNPHMRWTILWMQTVNDYPHNEGSGGWCGTVLLTQPICLLFRQQQNIGKHDEHASLPRCLMTVIPFCVLNFKLLTWILLSCLYL